MERPRQPRARDLVLREPELARDELCEIRDTGDVVAERQAALCEGAKKHPARLVAGGRARALCLSVYIRWSASRTASATVVASAGTSTDPQAAVMQKPSTRSDSARAAPAMTIARSVAGMTMQNSSPSIRYARPYRVSDERG